MYHRLMDPFPLKINYTCTLEVQPPVLWVGFRTTIFQCKGLSSSKRKHQSPLFKWWQRLPGFTYTMGPPKSTCLEVLQVNNQLFRWPTPLFLNGFWGLMVGKYTIHWSSRGMWKSGFSGFQKGPASPMTVKISVQSGFVNWKSLPIGSMGLVLPTSGWFLW